MKYFVLTFFSVFIFLIRGFSQTEDFERTDFKRADSVAELYPKHSLKDLKVLANKLTKPLPTEEEKFRAIYKWVCNNIEYDYSLFRENKQKREKLMSSEERNAWNKYFSKKVFKNLLNKQKTICTGYAYLIRELTIHATLPCVIVDGYGRTAQSNIRGEGNVNHSWNAVKLNAKWYLCDATWSSGAYHMELAKYVKKFDDSYFLPSPSLFIRNHYPVNSTWMLLKTKPTLHEFLNRPLIYTTLYKYKVDQLSPNGFDITTAKGKAVSFQFVTGKTNDIKNVELLINGPNKTDFIYPNVSLNSTGHYYVDQTFTTKGTHIVHILLNHNYAFTYTVKVK